MRLVGLFVSFCLLLSVALSETGDWRASNQSRAVVRGTSFGISCIEGTFCAKEVDGKCSPGVTGILTVEEKEGKIIPIHLIANIWTKNATAPTESMKKTLDDPGLLHFSKYPRMHIYTDRKAAEPAFEELRKDVYRVRALMDIKDKAALPVEFTMTLVFDEALSEKEGRPMYYFHARSRPTKADGELGSDKVSRSRLNMGGMSYLVDDGIAISVSGHFYKPDNETVAEPGRLRDPLTTTHPQGDGQSMP